MDVGPPLCRGGSIFHTTLVVWKLADIQVIAQGLQEVATTTVTVTNEDILPTNGVVNIIKTKHGYVTFTGALHVPGLDRKLILVPHLPQRVLQYEC